MATIRERIDDGHYLPITPSTLCSDGSKQTKLSETNDRIQWTAPSMIGSSTILVETLAVSCLQNLVPGTELSSAPSSWMALLVFTSTICWSMSSNAHVLFKLRQGSWQWRNVFDATILNVGYCSAVSLFCERHKFLVPTSTETRKWLVNSWRCACCIH